MDRTSTEASPFENIEEGPLIIDPERLKGGKEYLVRWRGSNLRVTLFELRRWFFFGLTLIRIEEVRNG